MTEREFIEEVRCRTGETPQQIGCTINKIFNRTYQDIFNIDHVYEDIIDLIDNRTCYTSLDAFRILFDVKR